MRDHRRLQAFVAADEVVMLVYLATRTFPKEEMFGLTSQMRRAAVSVASNIVEGTSRPGRQEYVRFLQMAHGSACELEYQAQLVVRLEYMPAGNSLVEKCSQSCRLLNALIRSLEA